MALIDRQYLARPSYDSRRMAASLATQGYEVNRKRVQRLMRSIALVAVYQRPNTSRPAVAHKTRRVVDRTGQPGLVLGHHLYPDAQGLSLSGGDHGLVQPCGVGVAAVEHARRRLLRRGSGGSVAFEIGVLGGVGRERCLSPRLAVPNPGTYPHQAPYEV